MDFILANNFAMNYHYYYCDHTSYVLILAFIINIKHTYTEQDWKLPCFVNKPASHSTLFVMIVINSYCSNAMVVGIALLY